MATKKVTKYTIKAKCKRQRGDSLTTATRSFDSIDADYMSDPVNPNNMLKYLQPLITDTITGFTLVKEEEYALGEDFSTVQAGVNEWEDELSNMKLTNVYTDGDATKKESLTYPSTDQTAAKYKAYALERAESMGYDWQALYGDVIGTSDTRVWVAD